MRPSDTVEPADDLQRELEASHARLSDVFRRAPAFMCVLRGPDHVFERVNERYIELVGGRPLQGLPVREAMPEVIGQGYLELLDQVFRTGQAYAGKDARVVLAGVGGPDGGERFVDFVYLPLRDGDGRVSGILVHGVDLTDRIRAERAWRASEQRLRVATEAAGLGVWVWEPFTDIVAWENDRPYEIFGMHRDEPPATAAEFVRDFVHPDDAPRFADAVALALERGEAFHFAGRITRRSDRQPRWIELIGRAQAPADGAPLRLLGTVADVTERRRSEDRLRISEEKYRALIESMDEGFCVIQMLFDEAGRPDDYRFVEANPAFALQTGLVDAVGRRMRDMVPGIERHWIDVYGNVALTGKPVRFVQRASAMGRWFNVYATRLGEPAQRQVAVLFTDVTAQHDADEQLRRLAAELAEADHRKNVFLATLAHELRNPLAPLRNGLQLLQVAGGDPAAKHEACRMMERQLGHLVSLVGDLLDVARISNGKLSLRPERVALDVLMRSAVETSRPALQGALHDFTMQLPDETLWLQADPTRISQVLSNLLHNAAKFTPPRGRVRLAARREGDDAVITVEDSGLGLAPESLDAVFEMFAQAQPHVMHSQGGLGIGLSLVRQVVELHGGQVGASSPGLGAGSCFTVRLPLAGVGASATGGAGAADGSPAGPAPGGAASPPPPPAALRVLVVDDNRDAGESLAMLLQIDGHAVELATSGPQALTMAARNRPDIAFLDIGMPGMNGYDVARALRRDAALSALTLVALTGWGSEDDQSRARDAGFDHHLTKPADLRALQRLLDAVRRAPPAPPPPSA